jgi:hypothetical protein
MGSAGGAAAGSAGGSATSAAGGTTTGSAGGAATGSAGGSATGSASGSAAGAASVPAAGSGKVGISDADAVRVRAWFAALPKVPASPAIAFDDGKGPHFLDGKQLLARLGKLAKSIRANIRAGRRMSAEYVKPPLVKPTLTTTSHEIREIMLGVTAPRHVPPGIQAEFLYDGDDKLVGVSVQLLRREDLSD